MNESFRRQGGYWKKKACPRRPKNQSKLAKKDQYDKARKENLCFNYFQFGHAKAACLKLTTRSSSSNTKKHAKPSRQVHTM